MILSLGLAMTGLAKEKIEVVGARASAVYKEYQASNAIDGVISDKSRWVGVKDEYGKIWLALEFKQKSSVSSFQLYSGRGKTDAIDSFHVEIKNQSGEWVKVPGSAVSKNKSIQREVVFEAPVTVKELRVMITKTLGDIARVKEVVLYSDTPSKSKKRILTI
ncbi:hypothetical protein LNTAR_09529 [Lentisphaera araneosa HTCC2155]|uniref:F5/8 type C domain-containing protein n=2 Tax=Lentisphaera TaxID=256846 RepID=A6DIE7_9BACT|nr:hypothetical protein LNTAR_09529 [Lentisphaera araneosa HTCC2155]